MLKNKILESLKCLEGDKSAIQEFIEKYMIDPDGLIVSYLNKNTLNVWTEAELGKYDILPIYNKQRGDPAGQLAYEDTLMATGEYASAMLAEFEVTGNHKAIASASFHVFAILRVLDEGEKYEKGFLPKPHGGMNKAQYSHEISPDQYIKAFIALREYQRYASPSLNKTIDGYLVAIADYFLNRNFCHPYRERTLELIRK